MSKIAWAAGIIVVASLWSLGCDWLNPSAQPQPTPTPSPIDPNAAYFTLRFLRSDGGPLEAFNVIQVSSTNPPNSAWAFNSYTAAIRKPNVGEKIYFAVDLGPDFEVAQLEAERNPDCSDPVSAFMVNEFNFYGQASCGPNPFPQVSLTIVGRYTTVMGIF